MSIQYKRREEGRSRRDEEDFSWANFFLSHMLQKKSSDGLSRRGRTMFVRSFASHVCISGRVPLFLSFLCGSLSLVSLGPFHFLSSLFTAPLSVCLPRHSSFSLPRRNYTSRGLAGRSRGGGEGIGRDTHTLRTQYRSEPPIRRSSFNHTTRRTG